MIKTDNGIELNIGSNLKQVGVITSGQGLDFEEAITDAYTAGLEVCIDPCEPGHVTLHSGKK